MNYIQQMLALSPNHPVAMRYLIEVVDRHIELIQTALDETNQPAAQTYLQNAEMLIKQYDFLKRREEVLKQLRIRVNQMKIAEETEL